MKTATQVVFWTIIVMITLLCLLRSSIELFAQFEADSSMFTSDHDGEPSIDFISEVKEYIEPTMPTPTVPPSTNSTVTSSTLPSTRSRIPEIAGLTFVVCLMLVFIGLAHINSAKYRLAVTERFRHIDLIVDASYDVMAVMNVSTNHMDISEHKFVPRSVYGKQLSVVRENSHELDNVWI